MKLLSTLNLNKENSGASTGAHWWSTDKEGGDIVSYNPTNGEVIAAVHRATAKDYAQIMQESQQAFLNWRQIPAPARGEVIRQIGNELRQCKDILGSLISLEMGKSKQEGDGEVQEMIDMADLAVGQARMLYGRTMHSERPQHRMYEQWHPLGTVAVISAFNFPVAVWAWNAFLAAICGNTVIWKPSPKTSLCAVAVQHICNRVLEKLGHRSIFSLLVSDDNAMVKRMATDTNIALLSFTGSTAVGREINQLAASRLGKVILELSGNNAVIIDTSADLSLAIPSTVFGAIGTAGQRCTTTRRLFIHEAIYDKTLVALSKAYAKITIGDPLDEKNLMGPLIDQHAVDQYVQAINDAKQQGGKVLFGGHVLKRPGFFVEPTIIAAQNDWEIVQRETFSPILYVIKFKDIEEAVSMQNHSRFGLSSALFTQQLHPAEFFLSSLGSDCGIANINLGTSGAEIGSAFGGEKDTGSGREAGSDAWKAYMRRQTNTIHWGQNLTLAQGIKFEI